MNTYTSIRTCVICPHCGTHTKDSVDHLKAGQEFGPWYCDECGGGYNGTANGVDTEVYKTLDRCTRTLDLLVLPPNDKPIYFVMDGKSWSGASHENKRFYYESHSCPTNWIKDTMMVSTNGNHDPHGFLLFIRSVPKPVMPDDLHEEESIIVSAFPELTCGKSGTACE